jgi:hypothetical protein
MDDLAVIDIELKFQVRNLQFEDQIAREPKIVEGVEPMIQKAGFWALPVTICSEMTGIRV